MFERTLFIEPEINKVDGVEVKHHDLLKNDRDMAPIAPVCTPLKQFDTGLKI
jgi:hypothetical protein